MTARPTTLRLMAEHCPAAVQFYEDGAPADRRVYAVGTAAHEFLHALGEHGRAEGLAETLMSLGRMGFDPEPPLPPDAVFEGRQLAERWGEHHPFPVDATYEAGIAFTRGWDSVPYGAPGAWLCVRPDVVFAVVEADEESEQRGVVTRDYKSNWNAGEDYLDTIQARTQAVAVWRRAEDFGFTSEPDFVRIEIANLRTLQIHQRTIDDMAVLERWSRDLEAVVAAHDTVPRIARPGVACVGCPYAAICPDAAAWAGAMDFDTTDPIVVARVYAAAVARVAALLPLVRETVDDGAIETPDGIVGYIAQDKRVAIDDAGVKIWEAWAPGATGDELVRGLLARIKWGAGQVESVAKALFPGRKQKAEREAWAATLLRTVTGARFGVRPAARHNEIDSPEEAE